MTQLNYTPNAGLLGAPVEQPDTGVLVSRSYPTRAEQWTITVGGVATDGTYSARFHNLPDGIADQTVSVVRSTTPATNTDLATAFVAAIQANSTLLSLFSVTSSGAVVTVVNRKRDQAFTLDSATAPAPGTLAVAQSVAASKSRLPLSIGVVNTSTGLRVPQSGDTAQSIDGITARSSTAIAQLPVDGSGGNGINVDGYDAGSSVLVRKKGVQWAAPEAAVSLGDPVYCRVVATGTEQAGALRGSVDGISQVLDVEPVEVNDQLYALNVTVKDRETGAVVASMHAEFTADASATETEITTALKADLDANANFLLYVTTGTDGAGDDISLRLTATSPQHEIVADDVGIGTITITEVTAGVLDTVKLPGRWEAAGAAGVNTPVRLDHA